MHCHCGTNNRAPRWTFTDPCKPEVRPGAREESASPAWLAAPAMNARDTTKVYIWRLETGCEPTLYRKCHNHNTPGKRHNNTWVEPLAKSKWKIVWIPIGTEYTNTCTQKGMLSSSSYQYLCKNITSFIKWLCKGHIQKLSKLGFLFKIKYQRILRILSIFNR